MWLLLVGMSGHELGWCAIYGKYAKCDVGVVNDIYVIGVIGVIYAVNVRHV